MGLIWSVVYVIVATSCALGDYMCLYRAARMKSSLWYAMVSIGTCAAHQQSGTSFLLRNFFSLLRRRRSSFSRTSLARSFM